MKVGFIGACFPPDILNELIKKDLIRDIPASVLGWKFVDGLVRNGFQVSVINELKITTFNKSHVLLKRGFTMTGEGYSVYTYPVVNSKILYHLIKYHFIKRLLNNLNLDVIVVYSLHSPYLKAAVEYAKQTNKKIICIVPDLPNYMFGNYKGIIKYLKEMDLKKINALLCEVDGFVLTSAYMSKYLNKNNKKKFLVIEGIADDFISKKQKINNKKLKQGYILYSGAITKDYGIPQLIDAYEGLNINDELWFCGKGDYVDELCKKCSQNEKIKYLGLKTRDEVKSLQECASLLVNPRNRKDEYTKYSFPSKTIEYLSSGTPVMMEKLLGIPDEYYKYIIQVENGWEKTLSDFFSLPKKERKQIGIAGQNFIKENKNIFMQGEKMKEFIYNVSKLNNQ